ncbi:TetR/AcrR family transcriptional regulator [Parasedimentitalea huanghaiensis]|uniref:TetR family transcriptional regulator n=1 Tax=Parasedimentitalea huanghaiensis TaxID=2682100 RepID=A0A6L6WG14_9RHOB|nr:TetR/AcrR family transcriptional regulator [Zongyanglinia huanghaiensis]MVO14977.1 TetR family transcriptional regulator [Zongyanglinia huanghaiensis]
MSPKPVLRRDDPEAEPLVGNIKVTRDDWLNVAMDVLISDGVERVKVLALAERMAVSRSSFYWYFKTRQDLLDALLKSWEQTNTAGLVGQAKAEAKTVTAAVLNVWRCTANPDLFNTSLDFAVRDWARRSGPVRNLLDRSDARRVEALTEMFQRYDFPEVEAQARAKALYYMQLGYDMAGLNESGSYRLAMTSEYLKVFTGCEPEPGELEEFSSYSLQFWDP